MKFLTPLKSTGLFEITFGGRVIKFSNGSTLEQMGADDPQKMRGVRHDILYVCEANELEPEVWMQMNIRTTGKIFLDFNPSVDETHWLNELRSRPESALIVSTYKDNPFLDAQQIKEIEYLINTVS